MSFLTCRSVSSRTFTPARDFSQNNLADVKLRLYRHLKTIATFIRDNDYTLFDFDFLQQTSEVKSFCIIGNTWHRLTWHGTIENKTGAGTELAETYSWYRGHNGAVVVIVLPSIPIWAASAWPTPVVANTTQLVHFLYRHLRRVTVFLIGEFRVWCTVPAMNGE